jgi:hypothetical protein
MKILDEKIVGKAGAAKEGAGSRIASSEKARSSELARKDARNEENSAFLSGEVVKEAARNEKSGAPISSDGGRGGGESKWREWLPAMVVGLVAFVIIFLLLQSALQPSERVINGLLVQGVNPRAEIAAVLAPQFLHERIIVSSEDEVIPGRAAAATEVASALAVAGKNVTVHGSVAGEYCVDSDKNRIECPAPQVVLERSFCNCISVKDGVLRISGTDDWMLQNGNRMRGLIKWALEKT